MTECRVQSTTFQRFANSKSQLWQPYRMVTMFGNISHFHVGSKSAIKLGMLNLQMEAKMIAKWYCLGPQLPTEHGWLDDLGVDTQFSKYPEDGGQGEIDTGTPFPSCAIVTTCAGVKWHGIWHNWHMIHFHPSHSRNPYHDTIVSIFIGILHMIMSYDKSLPR